MMKGKRQKLSAKYFYDEIKQIERIEGMNVYSVHCAYYNVHVYDAVNSFKT